LGGHYFIIVGLCFVLQLFLTCKSSMYNKLYVSLFNMSYNGLIYRGTSFKITPIFPIMEIYNDKTYHKYTGSR